jgi:hypothetical protein
MPFVSFLGSPSSSPGSIATSFGGPAINLGPSWLQQPFIDVITGSGAHVPGVVSVEIIYGLDIAVSQATVILDRDPLLANNTDVNIICGAGTHNIKRFRGLYKMRESSMWAPRQFRMVCEGKLGLAARYQQTKGLGVPSFINQRIPVVGLGLFDLLQGADPTDQNITLAALNRVPGLDVDPADIHGTGRLFGQFAWRDLTWQPGVYCLNYIQELEKVCLGYRTYENPNRIMRTQVFGYPTNVSDATFTEGIDIWEATGQRSILDLVNASYVEGYPVGGIQGLLYAYVVEGNDFQSADQPVTDTFSSPLIDGVNGDTSRPNPTDVANWRLTERNREQVSITLTTFRDDLLFIGRTIAVNVPHAAVTEPVWLQRVEIRASATPALWQQTLIGKGGGTPGTYTPPPVD